MKKETIVRKNFAELAAQPVKSVLSRDFSDEEIDAMAEEDGTDGDFGSSGFVTLDELEARMVPSPPKELISIRLDAETLAWYRSYGKGYQTFIGELLTAYKASQKRPPRPRTATATKRRRTAG